MVAVPTVNELRNRFPTFTLEDYSDAQVAAAIDEASRVVDDSWIPADQKPAIMYLAAHMLLIEWYNQMLGGGFDIPASVSFGDRSVSFRRTGPIQKGSSFYNETSYGEQFMLLARRNNPPVLVTGDTGVGLTLPVLPFLPGW